MTRGLLYTYFPSPPPVSGYDDIAEVVGCATLTVFVDVRLFLDVGRGCVCWILKAVFRSYGKTRDLIEGFDGTCKKLGECGFGGDGTEGVMDLCHY